MSSFKGASLFDRLNEPGYILKIYLRLTFFALSRVQPTRQDLQALVFMLKAPLLYIIGIRGELRTPSGTIIVTDRRMLRSFTYGFIKTHFAYSRTLRRLLPNVHFFPVVVDVGANIGDFSLAMTRLSGVVIALEPEPQNFTSLNANLQANQAGNVHAVKIAAHSEVGNVLLAGSASDMYVTTTGEGRLVVAKPIDLIAEEMNISRIDILKIDVQGHEQAVLMGLRGLLMEHKVDLLIVEVHIKRRVIPSEVITFMNQYGYGLVCVDPYLLSQPHLYFMPTNSKAISQTTPLAIAAPIIV